MGEQKASTIMKGFLLHSMTLSDADNGKVLWESGEWGRDVFLRVKEAHVPRSVLSCRSVSREITFGSEEAIQNLRLVQRVFLHSECIENWKFTFGFVIPGSTNTWQSTIEAASDGVLPVEVLSGNTVIETTFFDGDLFLCKGTVVVYYV